MDGRVRILVSGLTIVGVGIAPYVSASQMTAQEVEPARGNRLICRSGITGYDNEMFVLELRPLSETEFFLYGPHAVATGRAKVTFSVDEEGNVQGLKLAAERFYFDAKKVR